MCRLNYNGNLFAYFITAFIQLTVGAYNGIIFGITIPHLTFYNSVPLCFSAVKNNVCQTVATGKRITADTCYGVWQRNARQTIAFRKSTFV